MGWYTTRFSAQDGQEEEEEEERFPRIWDMQDVIRLAGLEGGGEVGAPSCILEPTIEEEKGVYNELVEFLGSSNQVCFSFPPST